jgi:hypothetical protein
MQPPPGDDDQETTLNSHFTSGQGIFSKVDCEVFMPSLVVDRFFIFVVIFSCSF